MRLDRETTVRLALLLGSCLAAGLAPGCGRISFDEVPVDTDDAGNANDAPDAPLGEFATPVQIVALGSAGSEDDPTVTADLLELYFETNRDDAGDIWVTTRASPDDPWGPPRPVVELNSPEDDETPEISPDGLTILLASSRNGNRFELFQATRPDRASPWSTPVLFIEFPQFTSVGAAMIDDSGLRMIMHVATDPGATLDLYELRRASRIDPFGPPRPLAELNLPNDDVTPFLFGDGLELLFASDRPGTQGALDLYETRRPDLDAPFEPPVILDELNSPGDDEDPWLSPDRRYLVFMSDRTGDAEIYETSR